VKSQLISPWYILARSTEVLVLSYTYGPFVLGWKPSLEGRLFGQESCPGQRFSPWPRGKATFLPGELTLLRGSGIIGEDIRSGVRS